MSKRKKVRQGQAPDEHEDAFVAKVLEASTWAEKNREAVILGVVVIALFAAGAVYYVNFRDTQREQAIAQLEQIQTTVSMQVLEEAKVQLGTFLDRFAGTPEADEALVLLGRLHLETGEAEVAINVLENGAPSFATGIGIQGNLLLARAYESAGRWPEAERQYLRIADEAELEFQVIESLEDAARARVRQQNAAGAAELYDRILARLDESDPSRGVYEMRLAEMEELAT